MYFTRVSETFFDQISTTQGRYIPVFAAEVYDQNIRLVDEGLTPINLTSIMIGRSPRFIHFPHSLNMLQGMDSPTFIPCWPHIMTWRARQCLCPRFLILGKCNQRLQCRCIFNPLRLVQNLRTHEADSEHKFKALLFHTTC